MQSKLYDSMLLLTLWFVFAFIFDSSRVQGDIDKVCNKLKHKAFSGDVQGLSAVNGSLYLMSQDRLYRLSMDRLNGSGKHSIALYDQGNGFTDLGEYSDFEVFSQSLWNISGIRHFNIWVNPFFGDGHPYRILWEALATDGVHLCNRTGTAMVNCTPFPNELNYLVGDGSGARSYYFRYFVNVGLTVNVAPFDHEGKHHFIWVPTNEEMKRKLYFVGLNEQEEIWFAPFRKNHLRPLVSHNGPIYGFIHSGVVHLWDLASQQSILFDDPGLAIPPQDYRMAVSKIPFEQYFVCSDTSDALGLTNPLGLLPVMGYILLGGAILLTLFLLFLKYKKKNSEKKSKDQGFKVMKGHKGDAKQNARKKMAKPMILSSQSSATSNLGWTSSSAIASSNASSVHVISTELNAKESIDPKLSPPTGFRQKKHKPI